MTANEVAALRKALHLMDQVVEVLDDVGVVDERLDTALANLRMRLKQQLGNREMKLWDESGYASIPRRA